MFSLKHGVLDNYSAFRYENFLQYIKKSLKSDKYPLQEIYNRITENQKLESINPSQININIPILSTEIEINNNFPFLSLSDKVFKSIYFKQSNTTINTFKIKDKYFMLKNNNIVSVEYIIQSKDKIIKFAVKKLINCIAFSTKPISSTEIGIYKINTSELSNVFLITENYLKYKCFYIPVSDNLAIISLLCHEIFEKKVF